MMPNDDRIDRSLLLVEDDPTLSDALAGALCRRGYEVVARHSIAEARAQVLAAPPRFAVVDLRLPDGSGLSLVPLLRQACPATVIVVLTGYANIATAIEAIKLGAVNYLCKPVSADELAAALEGRPSVDPASFDDRPLEVPQVEHGHIQRVLAENRSNISATARALGMHRRTLQRKLARTEEAR